MELEDKIEEEDVVIFVEVLVSISFSKLGHVPGINVVQLTVTGLNGRSLPVARFLVDKDLNIVSVAAVLPGSNAAVNNV